MKLLRRGTPNLDQLEEEIRNIPTVPWPKREVAPRDLDQLEPVSDEWVGKPYTTLPPAKLIEQPQVSSEDLGRITAEAIKLAHESAANALEGLGKDITGLVEKIEQLKAKSMQQLKECEELAQQHREAGKLMSLQVESAGNELNDVQDVIETLRKKLNGKSEA